MAHRIPSLAPFVDSLRTQVGTRVVAGGAAVLTIVAGSWGGHWLLTSSSCDNPVHLSVAAAPEIAPAIRPTISQWLATDPRVSDRCVTVDVTASDPADVAAAVAGQFQSTLQGVGKAGGGVPVPDVWIPDSTTWLQRLRAAGPDWVPSNAPSVAQSPVVLAMPEPEAADLGWPEAVPTWADVLARVTSDAKVHPGVVEPTRDATGLSGLLALTGVAGSGAKGQQATAAVVRGLAVSRSALRAELLARFPRAGDATALSTSLSAAPLSEQAIIEYNRAKPPVPLAALYVEPAAVSMDYPYTVLPAASREQVAAARAVNALLAGDAYRDRLAEVGLRGADGRGGTGFNPPKGAPAAAPAVAAPDPATISRTLQTWTTFTAPGRLLAVIDVSGSMLLPVPTAGGASRSEVTVQAATRGLGLLDDAWAVGLWIFSTGLDGARAWRQLVPIGPLASQRSKLLGRLATIPRLVAGGTGLYNTLLDAYRAVQAGWDPGRVNGIVIMTDGRNENPGGLNLRQLLGELEKVKDPARPVQVIALGIGDRVSEPELRRITDTTGGGTFIAADPSKIGEIFLQAIGLRPGAGD